MDILKRIKTHIQGYNKKLTTEYLDTLDIFSLLRLTHPLERKGFGLEAKNEGLITNEDYFKIGKGKGW